MLVYKNIQFYSIDYNGDLMVTDGENTEHAYFDLLTAQFIRISDGTPILPTEMRITKYLELPRHFKNRSR